MSGEIWRYVSQTETLSIIMKILGVTDDPEAELEIIKQLWEPIIKQRMVLACYKTGSDEIVGLNMNFVESKGDHFFENVQERVI